MFNTLGKERICAFSPSDGTLLDPNFFVLGFEASLVLSSTLYELAAALLPHKEILGEEGTVCEASTTHNSKRAFVGANHLDNPKEGVFLVQSILINTRLAGRR